MNEVYNFIEKLSIKNRTVVLAVSGGPDSMFLLNLLLKLKEKYNLKIVVAHVHHNIRKESDYEAEKLKKIVLRNNVIFEYMKIDKYPKDKFSEENARKIRYNFFEKVLKKYKSDILFTAHHGDDLIETILMKILRGSTIKGYSGFQSISRRNGYIIARPLVYLSKEQILEYLDKNNIWYALDMSNNSQVYKRNRIRKNILPELKKEDKDIHLKFLKYNNRLIELDNYINDEIERIIDTIIKGNQIDVLEFNKQNVVIKRYILEKYLYNIYESDIVNIFDKHLNIILDILDKNNSCNIDLPSKKIGLLEYNTFKIINKKENNTYNYLFDKEIILPNKSKIKVDNETKSTSNYVIHLNSKELDLPFHVRTLRDGDKMTIKNFSGTKKVSDIFTNSKISKQIRYTYPIVTDNKDNILWIPGIKKSNFDRKKTENYDIILKYEVKGGK